ncbi:MAG: hypothetical protein ABI430_03705 [Candidatus Taylorbacteria bacterium]
MKQDIKFVLFSVIFIGVCVSVWASVFVIKGGQWNQAPVSSFTPVPTVLPEPKAESTASSPISIDIKAEESDFEICMDEEQKKVQGVDYEKGSLLVSFTSSATFQKARAVIESNKLTYQSRENMEEDFKTNHWLGVVVPKKEEIKWICVLKGNTAVKNAILNRTFELHE